MKGRDFTGGLIVIGIGTILLLSNLGIANFSIGIYWPLILIFFGIVSILKGSVRGGLFFIFWGVLFQVCSIYGWDLFGILWPLIIIWFGIMAFFKPEEMKISKNSIAQDRIERTTLFSGHDFIVESKNFSGGKVDVAFGGVKVDLRKAKLSKSGAVLEVNCAFGGVEVFVSDNYQVVSDGVAIFGGWVNKFKTVNKKLPVLKIKGAAIFGAVEVKE